METINIAPELLSSCVSTINRREGFGRKMAHQCQEDFAASKSRALQPACCVYWELLRPPGRNEGNSRNSHARNHFNNWTVAVRRASRGESYWHFDWIGSKIWSDSDRFWSLFLKAKILPIDASLKDGSIETSPINAAFQGGFIAVKMIEIGAAVRQNWLISAAVILGL